jgi:hypothetical protein
MKIEFVTKEDLQQFKDDLINEVSKLLKGKVNEGKVLKSADIKKMLGISSGTLQTYRVNGSLPYSKIGASYFYELDDINKILNENKNT